MLLKLHLSPPVCHSFRQCSLMLLRQSPQPCSGWARAMLYGPATLPPYSFLRAASNVSAAIWTVIFGLHFADTNHGGASGFYCCVWSCCLLCKRMMFSWCWRILVNASNRLNLMVANVKTLIKSHNKWKSVRSSFHRVGNESWDRLSVKIGWMHLKIFFSHFPTFHLSR